MSDKITCQICGAQVHSVKQHLEREHTDWTVEAYRLKYPDAPLFSDKAIQIARERKMSEGSGAGSPAIVATSSPAGEKQPLHEIFELGEAPAAKSAVGKPIMISTVKDVSHPEYIPEIDRGYVFNIDVLKTLLLCVEMNIPAYVWGHMGTGKTTIINQIFARTGRPIVRIQHTVNTEESHVLGQWILRDGETRFQPGWLPMAMRYGWGYLCDEYDFAPPHVLSVYQPVLEGSALVIKEADEEWRVVKPHKDFRFMATGNTNGVGDETGLYQGTQIQNAANYERFGAVMKMEFMEKAIEKQILMARVKLASADADRLIQFAEFVRSDSKISIPISPRSLIAAARLGMFKADFRVGLALAYTNRLPAIEREVATQIAQRVFS